MNDFHGSGLHDRDRWFDALEAKEYGLIDDVIPTAAGMPGGGGTGA